MLGEVRFGFEIRSKLNDGLVLLELLANIHAGSRYFFQFFAGMWSFSFTKCHYTTGHPSAVFELIVIIKKTNAFADHVLASPLEKVVQTNLIEPFIKIHIFKFLS